MSLKAFIKECELQHAKNTVAAYKGKSKYPSTIVYEALGKDSFRAHLAAAVATESTCIAAQLAPAEARELAAMKPEHLAQTVRLQLGDLPPTYLDSIKVHLRAGVQTRQCYLVLDQSALFREAGATYFIGALERAAEGRAGAFYDWLAMAGAEVENILDSELSIEDCYADALREYKHACDLLAKN